MPYLDLPFVCKICETLDTWFPFCFLLGTPGCGATHLEVYHAAKSSGHTCHVASWACEFFFGVPWRILVGFTGWYIYLGEWLIFDGINVGKYTVQSHGSYGIDEKTWRFFQRNGAAFVLQWLKTVGILWKIACLLITWWSVQRYQTCGKRKMENQNLNAWNLTSRNLTTISFAVLLLFRHLTRRFAQLPWALRIWPIKKGW